MRTYAEISKEVEEMSKKYARKSDLYSSDEYKAIYAEMTAAYKSEGLNSKYNRMISNKRKMTTMIKKSTIETGIPMGLFV